MDEELGDLEEADLLVENGEITEIGPDIESNADVIDASGCIVIPGFVDTHRHLWQGALRNRLPNGTLQDYMRVIAGEGRPVYRPMDARTGNLVSALGALDAGITTVLDWSHINNTPDHTDAAIQGLRESGIRAVYGYGTGWEHPDRHFPDDIRRVRETLITDDSGLLSLALAAGLNASEWELARDVDARISVHVNGTGDLIPLYGHLGPDVTCIHCCRLLDEEWDLLARNETGVSISSPVEMIMGHGIPPIRQALDYGVKPSLSVDVETTVPGDMFTQMQSVFSLQRMQIHDSSLGDEEKRDQLLTTREVLRFATLNGAIHNGLDERIGTLAPGKRADLVMLAGDTDGVRPINDVYGAIVNSMDRTNVEMVMVDGEIKKWEGELILDNRDEIMEALQESRAHIFQEAGWT